MPRPTGPQRLEARRQRLQRHASVEDPAKVLDAAARFLEVRSRSVDEVRRHLTAARYPADLIERAIARLLELTMLDDRAFGRAWVESRDRARPRGEHALRRELGLKGLDRELIAEVLAERAGEGEPRDDGFASSGLGSSGVVEPGADRRAAENLLARRSAALARVADPRPRRQRAYALLARNGFSPEICREASARFVAPDVPGTDLPDSDVEDEP
jgi:regulatory protein